MTLLRERTEVRPPEVTPKHRPTRRSRTAIIGWIAVAVVVLGASIALAVWLIGRDGTTSAPAETPLAVSDVITRMTPPGQVVEPAASSLGDAVHLERLAVAGAVVAPATGDAYQLEVVSRRGIPTPMERFGFPFVVGVVAPLGPSPETGDARVLESVSVDLATTRTVLVELPSGDAYLLEMPFTSSVERGLVNPSSLQPSGVAPPRSITTVERFRLPSGEWLLVGLPDVTGPSPETGDASVLESLTRLIVTPGGESMWVGPQALTSPEAPMEYSPETGDAQVLEQLTR